MYIVSLYWLQAPGRKADPGRGDQFTPYCKELCPLLVCWTQETRTLSHSYMGRTNALLCAAAGRDRKSAFAATSQTIDGGGVIA